VRFAPAWLTEGPGQWEPGAAAHTRTRPAPSAAAHLDPAQPPLTPAHHHRTRPEFLSNNGGVLVASDHEIDEILDYRLRHRSEGCMRARAVRVKEPQHVVDAWIPGGRLLGLAPSMSSCGRSMRHAYLHRSFPDTGTDLKSDRRGHRPVGTRASGSSARPTMEAHIGSHGEPESRNQRRSRQDLVPSRSPPTVSGFVDSECQRIMSCIWALRISSFLVELSQI
jgi:hypothetical protein